MKELVSDDIFKHVHDFRLFMVIMAEIDEQGTLHTTFSKLQTALEYIHNRQRKQPSKSVIMASLERLEKEEFIMTARTELGTTIKALKYTNDKEKQPAKFELKTELGTVKNDNVVNNTNIYDQFYLAYGKQPTPIQVENLFSFHEVDGLELEVISRAIEKASTVSGHFNYLTTILKNWNKEGIKKASDLEQLVMKGMKESHEKYEGRNSRIDHEKYDFGF